MAWRCSDFTTTHVAAVAVGDHLLLQVLRGVACRAGSPRGSSAACRAGGAADRGSRAARGWRRRPRRRRRRSPCARPASRRANEATPSASSPRRGSAARGSFRITVRAWSIESRASARPSRRSGSSGPSGAARAASVSAKSDGARSGNAGCRSSSHTPSDVSASARCDGGPVHERDQLAGARRAQRRQREARQRLEDTGELERPEGAWMHAMAWSRWSPMESRGRTAERCNRSL